MMKKVCKGVKITMATHNGIVSTALLSLLFEKKRKDNLDLLRPFVECAICAQYSVGDRIDLARIATHMETEFGFEKVIDSVVESIVERLAKDKFVSLKHHNYFYEKSLEECRVKFDTQRMNATQLLETIKDNLARVFDSVGLPPLSEDEIHNVLYDYFEQYGLNIFRAKKTGCMSDQKNPYLFTLASYIIEQEESQTCDFLDIVQLYKGVLLSSAIYIQPENPNLYHARFKNTTVYLDTPMVLRILGLCSETENRRGKQFYELLKDKVAFKIFNHSLRELSSILSAYRNNMKTRYKGEYTLEFFDRSRFDYTDVTNYHKALPQTLASLGIIIDSEASVDKSSEEYGLLRSKLKASIGYYETHESALDFDVSSILAIRNIRGEKVATAIENCGAIFVTMNKALAEIAFEWQNEEANAVPLVISDSDLSVIMWLKEYRSKKDFPKAFIVANALGTLEAISDNFMRKLAMKVDIMQTAGIISVADVSLVLENIYFQRRLLEIAKGDINALSEEDIVEQRDIYKSEYARELGLDNEKLTSEVEQANFTIQKMTEERDHSYNAMITLINDEATDYAHSSTKWVIILPRVIFALLFAASVAFTLINIFLSGFENGILTMLAFIAGGVGILGTADALSPRLQFFKKLRSKMIADRYAAKYAQLLGRYEEKLNGEG